MRKFNLFIISAVLLLISCSNNQYAPSAPKDSDNDGVTDQLDQCPFTPAGINVGDTGCSYDSDGDGVIDTQDQCADTTAEDEVDASGCTIFAAGAQSASVPNCLFDQNTNECLSNLPFFPWPIPPPSTYFTPRDIEFLQINHGSLGAMADSLESILGEAGYTQFKYYNVPWGVAMATQLERIEIDGTPFPSPARWDINDMSLSIDDFQVGQFLRMLVGAEPGLYRVLVFVVTEKTQEIVFDQKSPPLTEQEIQKIADDGAISLPEQIRDVEIGGDYNLSILIYEMFRKRTGVEAKIYKSNFPVKIHLSNTEINLL
jgi:hypothetical protein